MLRKLQYIAVVAVVAMICIQTSSAQTEATAAIGASANIFSTLSTTWVSDIDFSNIATGQTPFIDPHLAKSSANWPYTGALATTGEFTLTGQVGQKVTFSVAQVVLTHAVTDHIDYLPTLSYGSPQAGSTLITPLTDQITLVAGPPQLTVWVGGHLYATGGSLPVPAAQASGTYTGSATITIDYVL